MIKPDNADHVSRRFLGDTPVAIPAQLPLADHPAGVLQRQVETAGRFGERDLLLRHDLGVPQDVHEGLRVGQPGHAQQESRRFDPIVWEGQGYRLRVPRMTK
jgi:hypothetical protein